MGALGTALLCSASPALLNCSHPASQRSYDLNAWTLLEGVTSARAHPNLMCARGGSGCWGSWHSLQPRPDAPRRWDVLALLT